MQPLIALARLSFRAPRAATRQLLGMNLSNSQLLEFAMLSIALNTLIAHSQSLFALDQVAPDAVDEMPPVIEFTPFMTFGVDFILMAASVLAVYLVGRMFGGTGTLRDSVLINAWMHYVMIVVLLAIQLLALLIPGMGFVGVLLAVGIFLYLLCNFVAEMHGFKSPWSVLFGTVAVTLVLSFIITFFFLTGTTVTNV